jgi:hypothetical protein
MAWTFDPEIAATTAPMAGDRFDGQVSRYLSEGREI